MKTFKQKLLIFISCFILVSTSVIATEMKSIHAVGLSVSTSSVSPNGSFTVLVSGLSDVRGKFTATASNAVGTSSFFAHGESSISLNYQAGSSGTATVTVTAADATYFSTDGPVSFQQSVSVSIISNNGGNSGSNNGNNNVPNNNTNNGNTNSGAGNGNPATPPPSEQQDNKSSESMLSSLSVSKGKLSPDFDENVTSYNLGLTDDVTSIEVTAKAKDDKATVAGIGKHDVKTGKTDINITVTAENGSIRTYTIHVTVEEKPKEFVKYNGQKLGILTDLNDVTPPEGFEKAKVKVSGKERDGWYNAQSKISLIYLADKDMIKNFYMVENNRVTSIYKPIQLLGKSLVIIDVPDILQKKDGMKFTTVTIDHQKLKGWTFNDKNFRNYYLIYVMDNQGNVKYYQYEKTEETLQLYSGAAPITAHDYEKEKAKSADHRLVYAGFGCSIALLAALIYMYLRNKKNVAYLMKQRRLNYQKDEDES